MNRFEATVPRRQTRFAVPAFVMLAMLATACSDDGGVTTEATLPADGEAVATAETVDGAPAAGSDAMAVTVDETADDESSASSTTEADDGTDESDGGAQPEDAGADETDGAGGDDTADPGSSDDADRNTSTGGNGEGITTVDWWGCWQAADAVDAGGGPPPDGGRVARLPNCATGPSSIGGAADLSHPNGQPIFRAAGAAGGPSIEFTFEGDTLLQTNGGSPWQAGDILPGATSGVTLAWVGLTSDVNSHTIKYLVSGLNDAWPYPQLIVEGDGTNRFQGYAGGSVEVLSGDASIADGRIVGVILHFAGQSGASSIEVDAGGRAGGQDSRMSSDVAGLTLGNNHGRNFSTTDHQFVFLGLRQGELSDQEKAAFWDYVARVG